MESLSLQMKIRELVEEPIQRLGFDLVAVEWLGGRRGPILRLSVEALGGVTAEDCVRVSHHVSPLLDAEDPIRSTYTLEVSSPGIARPVQRLADFERFQGYRAKIRLAEGPPRRRYTGVIGPVEDGELLLSVDGQEHRVPIDLIERAHLVLDLDEYQQLAEGEP
ncbi:MAG TPA: ribosome maturation factor RimP [Deltaproteobacteria bacterium]|nr:ribosome maturation factor RimP [Deltaproteobacteria bacterium]